jgi:hypothetical protein
MAHAPPAAPRPLFEEAAAAPEPAPAAAEPASEASSSGAAPADGAAAAAAPSPAPRARGAAYDLPPPLVIALPPPAPAPAPPPSDFAEALSHFGADDPREAAREIARMGQRELQARYRLVYGAATHSNNNDWLRRKLSEAVGALPAKSAARPRPRGRPAPPRAPRRAALAGGAAPPPPPSAAAADGAWSPERRASKRAPRATAKGAALASEGPKRARPGGAPLPASPHGGRSVLDVHRYLAHDVATTSTDEDEPGARWAAPGFDEEDDERRAPTARGGHAAAIAAALAARRRADAPPPAALLASPLRRAISGPAFTGALDFAHAAPGPAALQLQPRPYAPAPGLGADTWADALLAAAPAPRPPPLAAMLAPLAVHDDDDLLVPMDLSPFDAPGELLA